MILFEARPSAHIHMNGTLQDIAEAQVAYGRFMVIRVPRSFDGARRLLHQIAHALTWRPIELHYVLQFNQESERKIVWGRLDRS